MLPIFLLLALVIVEAAFLIYAKQTTTRMVQAAAQAGLATARLAPQGVPVIQEGTNQVVRVDMDLSNVSIQLDPILARSAVVDNLARNLRDAGWGTSFGETDKPVRMDLSNVQVVPLSTQRTDSIVFAPQLDRPRRATNDSDVLLVQGSAQVRSPILGFLVGMYHGQIGTRELTFPVQAYAEIRFRVGENLAQDFPQTR